MKTLIIGAGGRHYLHREAQSAVRSRSRSRTSFTRSSSAWRKQRRESNNRPFDRRSSRKPQAQSRPYTPRPRRRFEQHNKPLNPERRNKNVPALLTVRGVCFPACPQRPESYTCRPSSRRRHLVFFPGASTLSFLRRRYRTASSSAPSAANVAPVRFELQAGAPCPGALRHRACDLAAGLLVGPRRP